MTRTLRPRSVIRTAALASLVLALGAGCGGGGTAEDGGGIEQADDGETTEVQDDPAASDGGSDASDGGSGASDGGSAASDGGGDDGTSGAAAALPGDADLANEELPVSAEDAIEIAEEAAGGGELVFIEIDHDDDHGWVWEIEIEDEDREVDLDVDATTGEVLEIDEDDDRDSDPVVDVTDPLPYAEAIQLALGSADGRVSGWELDSDDGRVRYQIDIEQAGSDVEVTVDVETRDVRIDD